MNNNRIKGPRIILRPIQMKDAKTILSFVNTETAPNLVFFANGVPTLEKEREWIRRMRRKTGGIGDAKRPANMVFAVESLEGKFIGVVGLHEIDYHNKQARPGILIVNNAFRGQGYAAEIFIVLYEFAFSICRLHKIYTQFRVDNEAQIHMAEKFGFSRVGVLRDEYLILRLGGEEWHDFVRYELLDREWFALIDPLQTILGVIYLS